MRDQGFLLELLKTLVLSLYNMKKEAFLKGEIRRGSVFKKSEFLKVNSSGGLFKDHEIDPFRTPSTECYDLPSLLFALAGRL